MNSDFSIIEAKLSLPHQALLTSSSDWFYSIELYIC